MRIADNVLAVLDSAVVDGHHVRVLQQLDDPLAAATDKVLRAAGGNWSRSARAHIFTGDAHEVLEQILATGQITTPQDLGWFPTPPAVVNRMLLLADVQAGMTVLEPSAGAGNIARVLTSRGCMVDCVELDPKRAPGLRNMQPAPRTVTIADFLSIPAPDGFLPLFSSDHLYDRVIMVPPFGLQADIVHVTHALSFLKPGGRLVAVMSAGLTFRSNRRTTQFRELIAHHDWQIIDLPDNAFTAAGASVRTVLLAVTTNGG